MSPSEVDAMSVVLSGALERRESAGPRPPVLDVVVPVHNEETDLEPCLRRPHAYPRDRPPSPFRITAPETASTDAPLEVARRMAAELPGIDVLALREPGRGR